jgi:hypothetical protein
VRMKSSHILGTLELVGEISDLRAKDKWIVMNLRTTTPAGWNLHAALSYSDLLTVIKLLCRPKNFLNFLFGFCKIGKEGYIPDYGETPGS